LRICLVDNLGGLQNAIDCAARLEKLKDFGVREYPQNKSWLDNILNKTKETPQAMIKKEVGEENYLIYQQLIEVQQLCGSVQARLPFDFFIH
jgi:protease-4